MVKRYLSKKFRYGRPVKRFRANTFKRSPLAYAAMARAWKSRSIGLRNLRTGGLLGVEKKYFDTSVSVAALTAPTDASGGEVDPATVLCLNGVPQGDTASSRDGMEIALMSLEIEGRIAVASQVDQTAADVACDVYIALVLDTQTNGAQLNSEDVFANPSAAGSLAACPLRNMSNTTRFTVLKKIVMNIPQPNMVYDGTNIEQGGLHRKFRMFVPLKGIRTRFATGTTTGYVGTIQDNSLHLIAYCSSVTAVPSMAYNARLRFVG